MDTETSEVFATFRGDIQRVETRLQQVETRLQRAETRLEARIDATAQELRREIVDTRRHLEVLIAGLRDDVRLIAEGLVVVGAKVDRLIH
jgi:hypothetical protein